MSLLRRLPGTVDALQNKVEHAAGGLHHAQIDWDQSSILRTNHVSLMGVRNEQVFLLSVPRDSPFIGEADESKVREPNDDLLGIGRRASDMGLGR